MFAELLRHDRDTRSLAQVREHYEIEKELANRLRCASREERRSLYTEVYDELFRRVPHHPQHQRKADPQSTAREVARKMSLVRRYLSTDSVFLEIGPGDCSFAFEVARRVKEVYAVDVSAEISRRTASPANFRLILSDGCTVPAPEHAVTVAYSNQLMEHLHPDDALEQLRNIYRVLAPGGVYICITPNRVSGPHDVSGHFDPIACGLHLREYAYADLSQLLKSVGFRKLVVYVGGRGLYARFPLTLLLAVEWVLACLPLRLRQRIARSVLGRALLGITLVAIRPE